MKKGWTISAVVLLILALVLLVGPFLYPVPPLTGTVSEHNLADPDSHFVDINGVSVHYKESGQGEPVFILLHGFGASTYSWREVMRPLSQMGRVIAYDRPAFGLTSRPMPGDWGGTNPYSIQGNIDLLNGLMDKLGVDKAILVGNSAGAGVSVAYALALPDRVTGLVLVDPAVGSGSGGRFPAWLLPIMAAPQMRHLGPLLVRNIAGQSGDDTIRLAWHDPARIDPAVFEGYRKPLKANNWDRALYEFTIASNPQDYRSRLNDLKVPLLVVTGDDDRIVPTQGTLELAGNLPGAELAIMNQCGHVPQEECPQQFLDSLRTFVERVSK